MKSLAAALAAHYQLGTTTLASALRVARSDGNVYGFTSHDEDRVIAGVTYSAEAGLVVSDIIMDAGTNVGNLTLETLHDETIFTTADILGGIWKNASFLVFRYNWADPAALTLADVDKLLAGTVGNVDINQNKIIAELRDLRQYLQHQVGEVSSKTCRYRLGDSRCLVELSDFTVAGSISHITSSKRIFRDDTQVVAEDYFGEGQVTFTSGDAQGVTAKVSAYAANGTFTLARSLFVDLEVGDTFIAEAGCRKRLEEDCVPKFDNALRFGGEPHRRGVDNITASPDPSV